LKGVSYTLYPPFIYKRLHIIYIAFTGISLYLKEIKGKELEKILLDDYTLLYKRVVAWIAEKAKLPETSVRKILEKIKEEQELKKLLEESLAEANRNRV
jgi:hypothetical protein